MRGGVPLPGTRCRPQPCAPCPSYPAPHCGTCRPRRSRRPCAFCALGVSDIPGARGIPVRRCVLPRGAVRPGGYGLRGGRLRRQEEQAPCKEPCRPPYDMSHSLQSRYFDRTSYEFLRECKALIRKNTPQVFCFVVSAFRFRRFWFLRPVVPALLNLLFRAFRPVVPPCKSLFFWIFPELYLPLPETNIRSDENERLMRSVPLNRHRVKNIRSQV